MVNTTQCQRHTSLRAGKPFILPIFVWYSPPYFLVIWNSEFIFAKNLHEDSLRLYIWSWLVITAKKAHSHGRMSSEQLKHHYFADFRVLYLPSFLFIQNSKLIFAKFLHKHRLRPYIWIRLLTTAKTDHIKGQTSARACKPPILPISCAKVEHLFWSLRILITFL